MNRGLFIVLDGPNTNLVSSQALEVKKRLKTKGRKVVIFDDPELINLADTNDLKLSYANHLLLLTTIIDKIKSANKLGKDCILTHSVIKTLNLFYYQNTEPLDYMFIDSTMQTLFSLHQPNVQLILCDISDNVTEQTTYYSEISVRATPFIDSNEDPEKITEIIMAHISYARQALVSSWIKEGGGFKLPLEILSAKSGDTMPEKQPKFTKQDGVIQPTEIGNKWLEKVVTNTDNSVYAVTEELGQVAAAAAMARLSRRPGDMRDTLLEEFSDVDTKKDIDVLRRIISDYGDDSVTQLVGVHYVVEGASNLLTKHIEWGRLAAYLEQSTRYIYYDQKDSDGKYLYLRPTNFDEKILPAYEKILDKVFDNYSLVVRALSKQLLEKNAKPDGMSDIAWNNVIRAQACDAARPMLPVATKSTVGVFASGQALENMIMRLRASDLPEAKETADKILEETRKIIPVFLERADRPDRGGAYTKYLSDNNANMQKLADQILPATHETNFKVGPTLTSFSPKNELDLTAYMLYEYSDLDESQLNSFINTLSYDKKYQILQTYVGDRRNRRHKPGRALERTSYSWDILSDYGTFRDLQRHRMVSDLSWQKLSPRYGYDIPELVNQTNMVDTFLEAFDLSLELYSLLQAAGYEEEAQYATLLGHNMRWKITMNAREAMHFMELRTSEQGHPGYRRLVQKMYDQLAEVHPLLAESMKFINQKDSPELTRLEEEKRKESKKH